MRLFCLFVCKQRIGRTKMSGFRKTVESKATINGTKVKNNSFIVSSGIPSLDHIVGGGIPAGSIFAVEEDVLGNYSRVLTKYFLAEGLVCKHALFVASADEDPENIVKELPAPCATHSEDDIKTTSEGVDKMKIAWRYEGLRQVESSFGSNAHFGHHFDLSKSVDSDILQTLNITYCKLDNENEKGVSFRNPLYFKLLSKLTNALSQEEFKSSTNSNENVLRIGIQSLGSPVWLAMDCDEELLTSDVGQDLLKFLYCLRVIIRDTNAVAFVTIPSHLFDDENVMKRVLYLVDNAVKIESFAGSSRETNPVYKDYHGLFHITKLSAINSIVPYVPPSLDLAFKLKRKKFLIEKLHLPPELQESSEREQDDITAVPTCGGFKKKDIDF